MHEDKQKARKERKATDKYALLIDQHKNQCGVKNKANVSSLKMFISVIFGFSLVRDYRYIEGSWKFYEFQNTVKLEGPSTDF